MAVRFIKFSDLREKGIPWTRMHIDRLEKAAKFPRRVRLSPGTVVWVEAEINDWLTKRVSERGSVTQVLESQAA